MTGPGTALVAGRYRLERELGRHGSAATWLATEIATGLPRVLKRFRLGAALPGESAAIFEERARILAGLRHPGIPAFVELLRREDGPDTVLDLVLEFAEGESLADLAAAGRRLAEEEVRELLRRAAEPLAFLHARHPPLLHRNVRPSNVILGTDGAVRLTDLEFLARPVSADPLVTFGVPWLIGGCTPPEALRGEFSPAADVFSLGVVAIVALTGREPPLLDAAGTRWNAAGLVDAPPALTQLLARMTAADPRARFADAATLAAALAPPPPAPALPAPPPPLRRRRGRMRVAPATVLRRLEVGVLLVLLLIGAKRWKRTWEWLHPEISGPVIGRSIPPPAPAPPPSDRPAAPAAPPAAPPAPGAAPADSAVVEGRLLVDGRPLHELTTVQPSFWFRNEARGVEQRADARFEAGRFRVAGLPAGRIGMSVTVDLEPRNPVNYPGDLRAWTTFEAPSAGSLERDVTLHRAMRLLSPADNAWVMRGWGKECGSGTVLGSPVQVRWEGLGPGVPYEVRVDRMDCRANYRTDANLFRARTLETAVTVPLPPSPPGTCYALHLLARRDGEIAGLMMTHGSNGMGWDLRFTVR